MVLKRYSVWYLVMNVTAPTWFWIVNPLFIDIIVLGILTDWFIFVAIVNDGIWIEPSTF